MQYEMYEEKRAAGTLSDMAPVSWQAQLTSLSPFTCKSGA